MRLTAALILLFSALARAESLTVPAPCAAPDPRTKGVWEIGLTLQSLLPNALVDFDTSLLGYGPQLSIPVGQDAVQIQGIYGFNAGLTMHIMEAAYRLHLRTPFLTTFALAGVHFLHYSFEDRKYDLYGANFGLGVLQDLSDTFSMNLLMRIYVQKRAIVSFGGGFTILL